MGLDNPLHIAILLLVLLMVFGAKRLPEMGRGLGDGLRSFKDAVSGSNPAPSLTHAEHSTSTTDASIATPTVVPASTSAE